MASRSSSVMFFQRSFSHVTHDHRVCILSTPSRPGMQRFLAKCPSGLLLLLQGSQIGAVRAIRLTAEHLASTQKVNVFPSPPSARRTSYEAHGQRQQRQGSEVFRANIRDMKGCGFCGVRCSKHWVYQLPDAMNSCYHLTVHVDFTL